MPLTPRNIAAAKRKRPKKTQPPTTQPPTAEPPRTLTPEELSGEQPLGAGILTEPPVFNAKHEYHRLAAQIASAIPPCTLFNMEGTIVTLKRDPSTGRVTPEEMTPVRFTTWLGENKVCFFASGTGERTSLSSAQAETVLASDAFRASLPPLRHIEHCRLPLITARHEETTRDPAGTLTTRPVFSFSPAPLGYDRAHELFTVDTVPIDWGKPLPLSAARRLFCVAYSECALDGGIGPGAEITPLQSRSLGAVVTAHIGRFLHLNIDKFPVIMPLANQPGTGKTFLAQSILAPVHGAAVISNYKDDEKELSNTLNSLLLAGKSYVLFDDLKGFLNSTSINRFVTAQGPIEDRLFHTQKTFSRENRMQFFLTGNNLKTSPDLERRSIPIDLFFAKSASEQVFTGILSDENIHTQSVREMFLHACWSILYHWQAAGCPAALPNGTLKSFNIYTQLAINPTIWAGFANPLGPRLVQLDAGDTTGLALTELLTTAADTISPPYGDPHTGLCVKYTTKQLTYMAAEIDKLDIICPSSRDKVNQMGIALRRAKGREYTDSRGRAFRVGSARTSASSAYAFLILSEPTHDIEDAALELADEALNSITNINAKQTLP